MTIDNAFNRTRKGITPVVAIVMLLMLTIVVAGGAFAFLTGFFEDQQSEIERTQNTEVEFRSLECSGSDISFLLKNTGDTNIDTSAVDIYVYRISNNTLVGSPISTAGGANDLTVDSRHWGPTSESLTSGSFTSGRTYRVEIEFTSNDGPTVRETCTAG